MDSTTMHCTVCHAGSFNEETGRNTECSECEAGKFSDAGSATCSECEAGRFSDAGSATCSECEAGRFSDAGSSTCSECEAGKFSDAGSATCSDNCLNLDPQLNIKLELPAEHGKEIIYRCPRKQVKKDRAATVICQDGGITFQSGYSSCFKLGKKYV